MDDELRLQSRHSVRNSALMIANCGFAGQSRDAGSRLHLSLGHSGLTDQPPSPALAAHSAWAVSRTLNLPAGGSLSQLPKLCRQALRASEALQSCSNNTKL